MNYKSNHALWLDVCELNRRLGDFDLVVGIPRSGMLPATMLSQLRNCPLSSLDEFVHGRFYVGGDRQKKKVMISKVVVIDDSSGCGNMLSEAREKLKRFTTISIQFGAVYVTKEAVQVCDFWQEIVPLPRVWEWNLLHRRIVLKTSCMDIDGVLCRDPLPSENDDGPAYVKFVREVRCRYRPSYPVGKLVTSRLERYRPETAAWLAANEVQYGELVMSQYQCAKDRQKAHRHAEDKAKIYSKFGDLFIESDLVQAEKIYRLTGKPVYCVSQTLMFH